jgi:hypothetical protein
MNVFGEHLCTWSDRRAQDQTLRWQAFASSSGICCRNCLTEYAQKSHASMIIALMRDVHGCCFEQYIT